MSNKPTRYRLYDDVDGVTWAAESKEQLHQYDYGEAEWGNVAWPVCELDESEIDARMVDVTLPELPMDGPRDIISLREFMLTNVNASNGVQLVCKYEIWDSSTEPDAPFCGCGD